MAWTKIVCPTSMCGNRLLAYEPEEGIHAQVKCRNCKQLWEIRATAQSVKITPAADVRPGQTDRPTIAAQAN